MKYIMVLLMSLGICTFSMAQDYNMDRDASAPDAKAPKEQLNNNSMNNSNYQKEMSSSSTVTTPEVNKEVTTVNKTEKGESIAGVLWRSPFRIVGYTVEGLGKGLGTIGVGTAKVIVSPFRALGKAFRGHRHKDEVVETTTATTTQPGTVIQSNSSVQKTKSNESRENM